MFPLLEYLDSLINAGTCSYQSKDVAAARLVLLRPTHMVDYAIDMHKELHPSAEIPEEMMTQKAKVYQDLEELKRDCQPLVDLAQNQEERVSPILTNRMCSRFSCTRSLANSLCVILHPGKTDGCGTVER